MAGKLCFWMRYLRTLVARIVEITQGALTHGFDTTGIPAVIVQAVLALGIGGRMGLVTQNAADATLAGLPLGLWLLQLHEAPSWWQLLPGLMVFGWGTGMVGMTSTAAALDGIGAEELAMANATHQTARRLMQTLGTAVAVAVLGNRETADFARYRLLWIIVGGGYLLSGIVALAYPRKATPAPVGREPAGRLG